MLRSSLVLSRSYYKRKIFLVMAAGMAVPLTLLLQYLSSIVLLGICGFVFGFFLISAVPVGLTYAVEKTHPVPEATSNRILMLSGQISGLPIVFLFNMTAITVLFGAGLVLALLMQEIKPSGAASEYQTFRRKSYKVVQKERGHP